MFNIKQLSKTYDQYCNFHRPSEDIGQTQYFAVSYAPSEDANKTVFHICNVCYSRFINHSVVILTNHNAYTSE